MSVVYGVWDGSDYYGPHLREPLYAMRELAEAEKARRNGPYVADCKAAGAKQIPADWPCFVAEHEVCGA